MTTQKMPLFFSYSSSFFIPALGFTDEIHVMILLEQIGRGYTPGEPILLILIPDSWPVVGCKNEVQKSFSRFH
jgi:hypothetical protein